MQEDRIKKVSKLITSTFSQLIIGLGVSICADVIIPCVIMARNPKLIREAFKSSFNNVLGLSRMFVASQLLLVCAALLQKYRQDRQNFSLRNELATMRDEIRAQMRFTPKIGWEFLKSVVTGIAQQVMIGMLGGVLSFACVALVMVIRKAMYPQYNLGAATSDLAKSKVGSGNLAEDVVYTPIAEELNYRVLTLNMIRGVCIIAAGWLHDLVGEQEVAADAQVANANGDAANALVPATGIRARIRRQLAKVRAYLPTEDKVNSILAVIGSAALFAHNHPAERKFSALVGGLVDGWLYERYGVVSSMAAHAMHNLLTIGSQFVKPLREFSNAMLNAIVYRRDFVATSITPSEVAFWKKNYDLLESFYGKFHPELKKLANFLRTNPPQWMEVKTVALQRLDNASMSEVDAAFNDLVDGIIERMVESELARQRMAIGMESGLKRLSKTLSFTSPSGGHWTNSSNYWWSWTHSKQTVSPSGGHWTKSSNPWWSWTYSKMNSTAQYLGLTKSEATTAAPKPTTPRV